MRAIAPFERGRDRRLASALAVSIVVHGMWLGYLPGFGQRAAPVATPLSIHLAPPVAAVPAPAFAPSRHGTRVEDARSAADLAAPAADILATRSAPSRAAVALTAASSADEDHSPVASDPARGLPPPAAAIPQLGHAATALPDPAALAGYGRELAGAVSRLQRYPRIAQLRRWQGTAVVQLQVALDGSLVDLRVLSSSGHDVLDRQALEMVRAAAPLPPVPAALAGRLLTVDVPVVFRIAG